MRRYYTAEIWFDSKEVVASPTHALLDPLLSLNVLTYGHVVRLSTVFVKFRVGTLRDGG